MIPNKEMQEDREEEDIYLKKVKQPNLTYYIQQDKKRIVGHCDELEAIKQAVWKIVHTEYDKFLIYSWMYGIQLEDLMGEDISYAMIEIEGRIKKALLRDDRIEKVNQFEVTRQRNIVYVTFHVITELGDFTQELEVKA